MRSELPLHFITGHYGQQSHIAIGCMVNGREALLIIDTGASNSVMDISSVERFQLEPESGYDNEMAVGLGSSTIQSSLARAEVLSLGDLKIENFPFVLLDLAIINNTFRQFGSETVDGIIGTDILLSCGAKIDYKIKTVRFSGNKRKLRKTFRYPLHVDRD